VHKGEDDDDDDDNNNNNATFEVLADGLVKQSVLLGVRDS
jgi:hypothetical protein